MSDIKETAVDIKIAEEKQETVANEQRFIYLGPNLLKKGLQRNQVYIGDLPEYALAKLDDKYSLIRQLFAPIEKINEYQMAVSTPGTPQYIAYKQIEGGEN